MATEVGRFKTQIVKEKKKSSGWDTGERYSYSEKSAEKQNTAYSMQFNSKYYFNSTQKEISLMYSSW